MKLQKNSNPSGFITFGLVLLISASIFLLVCGSILLMRGEETIGAIICIVVGVVALLFFGIGAFLISHPEQRFAVVLLVGLSILICGSLTVAVLGSSIVAIFVEPLVDMEHYRQVWQSPASVKAVVTDHGSYDDDGDTDYKSYVTYIYDNVRYRDFPYENRDTEDALTPLGTEVVIQISPKDPTRQISELKRNSQGTLFSIAILFFGLAALYMFLQRRSLTKSSYSTPEMEAVRKDIKAKIRGQLMRPALLLCWIGYGFLYWRYSMVFGWTPLILAAVCGIGWLCCMYITIRDYRYVENGDYTLHRDILVDKREYTDSGSGTTYSLFYNNQARTWQTNVRASTYHSAKVGDSVLAVYLHNRKKPIIHYDLNGEAH